MYKFCFCIIFYLGFSASIRAEGSFFLTDIEALLQQQPKLWKQINSAFDVETVGIASRVGYAANKKLTGVRIGPYKLLAKPKGSSGKYLFELTVETDTRFLDDRGKEVPLEKAVDYKETLKRITIHEIAATDH